MIELPVDEAYAFDYLSILDVKQDLLGRDVGFTKCARAIEHQLGTEMFVTIKRSQEYHDLYRANVDVFLMIEALKADENHTLSAKDIDDANHERYLRKKSLQERFFKTQLTETKTYENPSLRPEPGSQATSEEPA